MVSYALCAIAEDEVRNGNLKQALETVQALRKMIAGIALAVSDPTIGTPSVIRGASEMAAELDTRLQVIESTIGPRLVH